jgi:hypothetical protein
MQRYYDTVTDQRGNALAGARVAVQSGGSNVSIYSDNGVTQKTNPMTTDASGGFSFYAANGSYDLVVTSASGVVSSLPSRVRLFDVADSGLATSAALAASSGASLVGFVQSGAGAVARDLQDKAREVVSILDDMTIAQKADARSGALSLDLRAPIQSAIDYLESIGGGVLEWYDAKVIGALTIQSSNITIRPRGGRRLVQAGSVYNTFLIYPESLDGIWDGTGRPAGFANGIDGAPELLMYESNDAYRLHDVRIEGLSYTFTGASSSGRFIDAFSVDRLRVIDCYGASAGNTVTAWYCRDAKVSGSDVTAGTGAFPAFFFKSYGEVDNNSLRGGFNGFDGKGCYPQAGKATTEAFDVGYEFFHPIKVHGNRVYNASNYGLTSGYLDNSSADISATTTTGVSKSSWYGQVWGVEITDNTVYYSGTPAVGTCGIALNINSKHFKVARNTLYGVGIGSFCSEYNSVHDNTIINHRATSTPAILLQGGTFGATSRNSRHNSIKSNRIIGTQTGQPGIWIKGGDYNSVDGNECIDGSTGTNDILVDSTTSASTSTGNRITGNTVSKTAADFAYPIKSTGAAGTIIEGNRAFGGWYSGNALDSDGFADNHYKRGIVSADTPTAYVGTPGTCYVGQNFGDQNATTAVTGYADEMAVNGMVGGSAYRQAVRFGAYFLWVDSTGDLRIKATKPTSDTDGAVVGTQS